MSVRLIRSGFLAGSLLALASCGGGGGGYGGGGTTPPASVDNKMAVAVDGGPAAVGPVPNVLYTSVTVCVPNTTTCVTVDHVQIDTQSVGLRLMASAVNNIDNSFLGKLTQTQDGSGNPIFDCITFADGWSWGALVNLGVQLTSDETVGSVPAMIIEDPATSNVAPAPADCVNGGPSNMPENLPSAFGANGLLGVGAGLQDCGSACATSVVPANYYSCTSATSSGVCTAITMAVANQIQNPVSVLSGSDNNGVIIVLPAVSPPGSSSVTGTMYIGVGTQSNNKLPASPRIVPIETNFDQFIHTTFPVGGTDYPESVIDVGSNAYFFTDSGLPNCTGAIPNDQSFFCVGAPTALSAVIQGEAADGSATGDAITDEFDIDNADSLFTLLASNPAQPALPNLGGGIPAMVGGSPNLTFDWGLPFLYGKTLYVVFADRSATGSGQAGPYMSF